METARTTLPRLAIGTMLCGMLAVGCGGGSSDGDDPDATPTPTTTVTPTPTATAPPDPVVEGARLFLEETFDGNGRTCGTCHPAENGLTLSPEFVATLPPNDPLFVAERVPALAGLENPALLRGPRALILENVDGFDQPPVFRGVPHTFDLATTAPFGWGGTVFALADFVDQAVRQHFPRTLNRVPGIDFRLPTADERAALVAFMESTRRGPAGFDSVDFRAFVRTESEERGRLSFFGRANCFFCHNGPLLTNNGSFDTGVTRRPGNDAFPAGCTPPCTSLGALEDRNGFRRFNTPTLFGLTSSAPFFHDNSAATIRDAVAHYTSPAFNASDGAFFSGGIAMTDAEIDDVTAFLEALSR
jgi:cytochrome c peroxidase